MILVGDSYGGVVITEAGNDPKVAGLVYIAAFAPDKGESVSARIKNPPPGAPVPPIMPPQDGICSSTAKFRESFAADVAPDVAAFMADSQVPWGLEALNGAVTEPAGGTKPSWYLGVDRRQDDSARCAAGDVQARWFYRRRGQGESFDRRVATEGCCRPRAQRQRTAWLSQRQLAASGRRTTRAIVAGHIRSRSMARCGSPLGSADLRNRILQQLPRRRPSGACGNVVVTTRRSRLTAPNVEACRGNLGGRAPKSSLEPTSKTWSVAGLLFCLRAQFGRANPNPGRYELGSN